MKQLVFIFLLTILFLPSCSVWNLNYSQAGLSNDFIYNSIEMQTNAYMKKIPLTCGINIGYASLYSDESEYSYYDNPYDEREYDAIEESGLSFGLTPTYYITSSRLQPYIASRFNSLWTSANIEKEDNKTSFSPTYLSITPQVGLRYFFSRRFAINGSYGYQWGKTNLDGYKIPKKINGTNISFGLTLTF